MYVTFLYYSKYVVFSVLGYAGMEFIVLVQGKRQLKDSCLQLKRNRVFKGEAKKPR